jgi:hypothetical protein
MLSNLNGHCENSCTQIKTFGNFPVLLIHSIKFYSNLVEEASLNTSNYVCEPVQIKVLSTVREEQGNLFVLNITSLDQRILQALNRGGQALLEDVLIVLNDLQR